MAGIATFAVCCARSGNPYLNTALIGISAATILSAIVAAYLLAFRHGMQIVQSRLAFLLTDEELVRKSDRYPEVRIRLSEISALYEHKHWLFVESAQSASKITIPTTIEGFESLREELGKHSPLTIARQSFSLWFILIIAGYTLCWSVTLWSHDAAIVGLAGSGVVVFLIWQSLLGYRQLRRIPQRFVIWLPIALSWLAAVLLLYLRIAQN